MSEWDFAFGLTGQALEDALSSGATYEEWAVINRQLEQEFMDTDGKGYSSAAASLQSGRDLCGYCLVRFGLQRHCLRTETIWCVGYWNR
jgi:hypothetical protein